MKYLLSGQETKRLRFRPLRQEDRVSMLPLFQKDVGRFIAVDITKSPEDQCKQWFDRQLKRYEEDRGGLNILESKETGEVIGTCGLLVQVVNDQTELEVGYSILPAFWNRGYASEAARKCRDYAFENNLAESLISIIHVENVQSMKVAQHNGMSVDCNADFMGMPVNIYRIYKKGGS